MSKGSLIGETFLVDDCEIQVIATVVEKGVCGYRVKDLSSDKLMFMTADVLLNL